MFAKNDHEPSMTSIFQHDINTRTASSIHKPHRCVSVALQSELDNHVKKHVSQRCYTVRAKLAGVSCRFGYHSAPLNPCSQGRLMVFWAWIIARSIMSFNLMSIRSLVLKKPLRL